MNLKNIKKILVCVMIAIMIFSLTACREASVVNHNLSKQADYFQCCRRITVYNARTDNIILYLEGYMALSNNSTNELVVTCKTGEDEYKKNYVYLNEYTVYVVEDITGTVTDPYHYVLYFPSHKTVNWELEPNAFEEFK